MATLAVMVTLALVASIETPAHAQVYDAAYTQSSESRDLLGMDNLHLAGSAGLDGHLEVDARVGEAAPAGVRAVGAGASGGKFYSVVEKAFHVSGAGQYSFVERFRVNSVIVTADAGGITSPVRGAYAKVWIWAWPEYICDGCTRGPLHAIEMFRIACTGDTSCGWTTGTEFTLEQGGELIADESGTFYVQIVLVADVSANGRGSAVAAAAVDVLSVDMV